MDNSLSRFFRIFPFLHLIKKAKITGWLNCLLIFFLCTNVNANQVDRGQLLYENHCLTCHAAEIHQRSDRKVHSLIELNKRVIIWQHYLKLDWELNDVRQVTNFLNREFYNFPVRR